MKLNQKGALDLMLVIALVAVIAVGGFVLMRINNSDNAVSDTETTEMKEENEVTDAEDEEVAAEEKSSVPDGWVEYENEEFGFSVYLPDDLDFSESKVDYTDGSGYGNSDGKELILSSPVVELSEEEMSLPKDQQDSTDKRIYVKAATSELLKDGTGLHPASYGASKLGYSELSGSYYVGDSADDWMEILDGEILNGTEAVCGKGQHSANGGPDEYMCVFNTSIGGFVVTTFDSDQFDTIKQIAGTVTVQ